MWVLKLIGQRQHGCQVCYPRRRSRSKQRSYATGPGGTTRLFRGPSEKKNNKKKMLQQLTRTDQGPGGAEKVLNRRRNDIRNHLRPRQNSRVGRGVMVIVVGPASRKRKPETGGGRHFRHSCGNSPTWNNSLAHGHFQDCLEMDGKESTPWRDIRQNLSQFQRAAIIGP